MMKQISIDPSILYFKIMSKYSKYNFKILLNFALLHIIIIISTVTLDR